MYMRTCVLYMTELEGGRRQGDEKVCSAQACTEAYFQLYIMFG